MDVPLSADGSQPVVFVNLTDDNGVLLGRFSLTLDDLCSPEWIGQQMLSELPAALRPAGS